MCVQKKWWKFQRQQKVQRSSDGVCLVLILYWARATFSLFLISSLTLRRMESCFGAFFDSFDTFFHTRSRSRYHCLKNDGFERFCWVKIPRPQIATQRARQARSWRVLTWSKWSDDCCCRHRPLTTASRRVSHQLAPVVIRMASRAGSERGVVGDAHSWTILKGRNHGEDNRFGPFPRRNRPSPCDVLPLLTRTRHCFLVEDYFKYFNYQEYLKKINSNLKWKTESSISRCHLAPLM